MKLLRTRGAGGRERGSALVLIGVLIVAMSGLVLALLTLSLSGQKEVSWAYAQMRAYYAAEAAAAEALERYAAGGDGAAGTEDAPLAFGGATYWVESEDLGNSHVRFTATGVAGLASATLEVIVRSAEDPFLGFGIFGDKQVKLGSNARIDSYDSRLGSYASQAVEKYKGKSYASDSGNVGSNESIDLSSNAIVFGDATPGPGFSVVFDSNSYVMGSTTPASGPIALPPVTVPDLESSGSLRLGGNASHTIGPGAVRYDELELTSNAVLNVIGPMTLIVDSVLISSNTEVWVDPTAGPLTIYATGDFTASSNSSVQSTDRDPLDVTLILSSDSAADGTKVDLNSNGGFYGTIYGPRIDLTLDSNFALFGALRVRTLEVSSNSVIHLDEALMSGGGSGGSPVVLSWRLASMGRVSP